MKAYISEHKKEYKNILYTTYESNLRTTIADISFKDDVPQETIAARFERHSEYLKLMKTDSLIIIDNFDILPDEDGYCPLFLWREFLTSIFSFSQTQPTVTLSMSLMR